MSGRKYYCYCDSNCKFETMTKEQILAAIEQAARWDTGVRMVDSDTNKRYALYVSDGKLMMRESNGSEQSSGLDFDLDAAIIDKVKETNAGGFITFWIGTQVQYNALASKDPNCYYHITDSTRDADIYRAIEDAYRVAEQNTGLAAEAVELARNAATYANEANSMAEDAKQAASNALSVANSKTNGMAREFADSLLEALTYTTTGTASKFYLVTVGITGTLGTGDQTVAKTIVADYKAIESFPSSNRLSYYISDNTRLYAQKNEDKTVTFTLNLNNEGYTILHVAGYY